MASNIESASETGVSQWRFPFGPAGAVGVAGESAKLRQQSGFEQFASEPGCHHVVSESLYSGGDRKYTHRVLPVNMHVAQMHDLERCPPF